MKQTLIVVALCSLFSCGADTNYFGRLHQSTVAGEASSRSSRSVSVSFDALNNTLHVDGLDAPFTTAREAERSAFEISSGGDVLGGLGTVNPMELSFSVLLVRRSWPYGFITMTFDGSRSETPKESEPETIVPVAAPTF